MTESKAKKKTTAKETSPKEKPPVKEKKIAAKKSVVAPDIEKEVAPKLSKKTAAESYENDLVQVQFSITEDCQASLEVQISEKLLQESHNEALKQVSKEISVPGFRKGKVPREFVEKNYGKYIEEQAQTVFMQKALEESLNLTKLRPLNYRNVKPKLEKKLKNSAIVQFTFETYPVVPQIDLEKIKLSKMTAEEVTPEQVDDVIDVMRTYRAKWETITDRPIQENDFVDINIENVETKAKIVDHKRVQVCKGKLSSWLIKLLTGMNKGESQEATSQWDKTMPQADKKDFVPTLCKVTVLEIFKGDLPPVDEDFAKAMGTQSVADLRTQVLLRLTRNAEDAVENKQKHELDEKLEKLVDFSIPKSLIEAEKKTKIQMKEYELKQAGVSDKDIAKQKSQIEQEGIENAIKSLKLFFILQKIANDHGIIVSEQELREVMAERISQLNLPTEYTSSPQFKNHIIQEIRMNCFVDLLTDKVKNFVLKKAIYN